MKTTIAILAIAFLAATPAAAKSAASKHAPGHQQKAIYNTAGHSYWAPGHVKKRMGLQSARSVAPGAYERR
jgi:hypothetical protein